MCILPLCDNYFAGQIPFYRTVEKSIIPSEEDLLDLSAVEDLLMVGYPQGLYDIKNNFPLFRQGISASHPAFDRNGKSEFLADIASFPGSSGSPVFIYDKHSYQKGNTTHVASPRILFMGVINLAHLIRVGGDVKGSIPELLNMKSETLVYSHLGHVIQAQKVLSFENLFDDWKQNMDLPKLTIINELID